MFHLSVNFIILMYLKQVYFFWDYFIVFARDASNASISGLASTFANGCGSENLSLFYPKMHLQTTLYSSFDHYPEYMNIHLTCA